MPSLIVHLESVCCCCLRKLNTVLHLGQNLACCISFGNNTDCGRGKWKIDRILRSLDLENISNFFRLSVPVDSRTHNVARHNIVE